MENNEQNSIELTQQSGRVCINNLQRRDNSTPLIEEYTVELTHRTDQMCLGKMQHTHGSYMTAGSTAYSIIKKIEYLFNQFKLWFQGFLETITAPEVHAMWDDGIFRLDVSKLNVNKLS